MAVKFYVEKVLDNLYILRVDDGRVRFFEALWEIPEGVTYNAYVVVTREGAVLFDGWKREYGGAFLEALRRVVDPRDIKWVVTHHGEPDHSGTMGLIAEATPNALFLGHPVAGRILKSHYGVSRFKPMMDNEVLEVGEYRIRALHTPWLHWPDTIVTFIESEGVLLTCDIFGSFSLPPLFDDQVDLARLSRSVRKYIITVVGHYIDWIPKNIEKVGRSVGQPRIIAPGHGTVYRSRPQWVVAEYLRVASGEPEKGKAVLVCASTYGNVERAMEAARAALEASGWRAVQYCFTDEDRPLVSEVLTDASDAELLVIGASAYESAPHPVAEHLVKLIAWKLPHRKSMPVIILASYGWSPAAGKRLAEILATGGFSNVRVVEFEGGLFEAALEKELKTIGAKSTGSRAPS